ncbi:MAG: hypothetical protein CL946_09815 [Ectothiorhodospiraceae bacterium]|nr:hypothetical protein [Ectothiorhodospiraceae bacterium]
MLAGTLTGPPAQAQLVVDSTIAVDSLVNNILLGSCVVVSNIQYTGARSGIGYFDAMNTNLGVEEGIILGTGNIFNARGPNDNPGKSSEFGVSGDPDLTNLAGIQTFDASVLEFDFVSSSDTVKFNYVFASEEYPEFVGDQFNDVFVFYVSGPGITGQENIALIPGTVTPVAINNLNAGVNSQYYIDNIGGASVQYDGFTVPLEAKIAVQPGQTYHMKIAIADALDGQTDSGVFLEAGSFRSGERILIETLQHPVEGCRDGLVRISRREEANDTLIVELIVTGSAASGVDFEAFPTAIMLLPGQFVAEFPVKAFQDGINDPGEVIIITLDNKCIGTDPSVDILNMLEDALIMTISDDVEICRGESVQLEARVVDGEAPFTYHWAPSRGLDDTTSATPIASPDVTTTYTVTVTDAFGCDVERLVTVFVDDIQVDAGDSLRLCYGEGQVLNASVSNGTSPYTYRWTPTIGLSADSVLQPVASPLTSQTYFLEVEGANGCSIVDSVFVFVGEELLVDAGNDTMICESSAAQLSARVQGGSGPYSFNWSPIQHLSNHQWQSPDAFPPDPTMYTVEITDADGCVTFDSVFVDINRIRADAGTDKTICAGASIPIGNPATNGVPPYTYTWTPAQFLDRDDVMQPVASPPVTTDFIMRAEDAMGCVAFDTLTISVGDIIKPAIVVDGSMELCEGESVSLSATSGFVSYQWSNGATAQTILIDSTVTLAVTVMDNLGCEGTSDSITIIVHELPQPVVEGPNSVCRNSIVEYNAVVVGGNTYSWSVTGGNILSGQNTPVIQVEWTAYGVHQVILTETAGITGCSETMSYEVLVDDSLRPALTVTPDSPFCDGDTVLLSAPKGYSSYRWSTGEQTQEITVRDAGTYWVEVELDPTCTGTSPLTPITFEPLPQPVITPPGPITICANDSVLLDAGTGFVSYEWSTGADTRTIWASQSGQYFVTVTDANGCSNTSPPVEVQTRPLPPVPVITRTIDSLFSTSEEMYQWYRNDTLIEGATNRFYVMQEEGIYKVVVTDAFGCSNESDPFEVLAPLASSTISIPDVSGEPGEPVRISVVISESVNLGLSGVDQFRLVLKMDGNILAPLDQSTVLQRVGNELFLELTGSLGDTVGELAGVRMLPMLGPVSSSPLTIESFQWLDNFVRVYTDDGEFQLIVCEEGGPRLFDIGGGLTLAQNHPNPFNASTVLEYELIERGHTELYILDALGRRITTLFSGTVEPGEYSAVFHSGELPTGLYIAVLQTPTQVRTRLMEVVK